jgi:hypothetical protein
MASHASSFVVQSSSRAQFLPGWSTSCNNPLYLTDEQKKHRETNGIKDYNYGADTPEATDAFIRWVKAAVTYFKGQGVLWELWNEPNRNHFWRPVASPDAYIDLAVKVGAAIRSMARSEYFVGPACNGVSTSLNMIER